MPFDFKAYDEKCRGLTPEELQREWQHYTRLISGASTSTAISGLAVPLTMGVSTIGVAMAAPAIHNARKKRAIIEKHLQKYHTTHVTRKRDVLGSMAISGTIGVVTMGVGSMGADAVATAGAEHGISAVVENELAVKVVTHAALDGVGLGIEHAHTNHLKKRDAIKAFKAAGVFKAVENAKVAEAGYIIQPYNPQTFAPGSNMAQIGSPPPPPPYTPGLQRPPSYYGAPDYAYASDSKAPVMYGQSSYDIQPIASANTGQCIVPQLYNYNYGQPPHISQAGVTAAPPFGFMSQYGESQNPSMVNFVSIPQANCDSYSVPTCPQTPAQPLGQVQTYQPQQQPDKYTAPEIQTMGEPSPNDAPSSVSDAYDMKTVAQSLPGQGEDSKTTGVQQEPQLQAGDPIPTLRSERQTQETRNQSLSLDPHPPQHVESVQTRATDPIPETPQSNINKVHVQTQNGPQQGLQLSPTHQRNTYASRSISPQRTEIVQCVSHPVLQPYSSPPIQEIQDNTSSLCGPSLAAPFSITAEDPAFNYREHVTSSPLTTQRQSSNRIPRRPVQGSAMPQEKIHEHPHVVHQQYPSYVEQQQVGIPGAVFGQQVAPPTSQTMRYSLQSGLSPSPLPTPSPHFTPVQSQGIPYFPPPPGQPQNSYSHATFPPPPTHPSSYASLQKQDHRYSTPEMQYPPVPIPEPYSPARFPTSNHSHHTSVSEQQQHMPQVPLHSKLQQYPYPVHNMPGYSQTPLTPPYSPPQTVQHTRPSYFPTGANLQYQGMHPTHYR